MVAAEEKINLINSENVDADGSDMNTDANTGSVVDKISEFGLYLFNTMLSALGFAGGFLAKFARLMSAGLRRVGRVLGGAFKRLGAFLAKPFLRYAKAMKMGGAEVKNTYRQKGALAAVGAAVRLAGRIVFGKRGLAVTVFNYALPIISCVFLFNIVSYANSMTYALTLNVNGDFVGYIDDENVFDDAERIVQQRITYTDGSTEPISFEPAYGLDMVGYGRPTLTKYQLADKLLMSISENIDDGYGMYIGDAFYGALLEKDKVERTLDELLSVYRTGAANETVQFESDISFVRGLYLSDSVVNEDAIIRQITSKKKVASYYTVKEGDSPSLICEELDMTYDEIAALNPGFSDETEVFIGDKLLIDEEEPFLAVTVTRKEVYDVSTEFETEYYDDSTRYTGAAVVTQPGVEGIDRVTADVSYINGVEVRRKVLSRKTIEEPVTEYVALGIKPRPTDKDISIQDVPPNLMYWPVGGSLQGVAGGLISEMPYGYGGYYNHSGVDIAAPYGTPIYAADSGTVVLSQWYYDYGYCVMIQHPNGLKTLYGHASFLHVNVGDEVTQGEQIADVGSTGRSSGNHLHFEVRVNDQRVYPLDYLPWHQRASWCNEY